MNLGCIDDLTEIVSAIDRGVILHEFGHILGLGHEYQSPRRDGGMTLKAEGRTIRETIFSFLADVCPAVMEYYTARQQDPWSRQDVQKQILDVYNLQGVSNYPKLDMKSIMMCVTC